MSEINAVYSTVTEEVISVGYSSTNAIENYLRQECISFYSCNQMREEWINQKLDIGLDVAKFEFKRIEK